MNRFCENFRKTHKKIAAIEYIFNKVEDFWLAALPKNMSSLVLFSEFCKIFRKIR